jgi:hypothetical protein
MKKKMFILCGLLIEKYRTAMKTTSRKEKRSTAAISVCSAFFNNHKNCFDFIGI